MQNYIEGLQIYHLQTDVGLKCARLIEAGPFIAENDPPVAMLCFYSSLGCKVLKAGKSMSRLDEPPYERQLFKGIPTGEQAVQGECYVIGVDSLFAQSAVGGLCPLPMMGQQQIDPFPVVSEWGTVAGEREFHVHLPELRKTLQVVSQGIRPVQQELNARRYPVTRNQNAFTLFIETAMTDGVAGGYQTGELIVSARDDVPIRNIAEWPGALWPVLVTVELRNHTHRVLLRETQQLEEGLHFFQHFSRCDSFDEFAFRPAYVYMRYPAEEPGNSAEVIEMVMRNEEIGAAQVQAEVPDRILHKFVADRMRHSGIDDEMPVAVGDHV